jgi:hypothetical protein
LSPTPPYKSRPPLTVRFAAIQALAISMLFTLLLPAGAFESNVFSLENEQPAVTPLDTQPAWGEAFGIAVGLSVDDFVVELPITDGSSPDMVTLDWPPRVAIELTSIPSDTKDLDMEPYYPGVSSLIEKITIDNPEDRWFLTVYLAEPLPYKSEIVGNTAQLRLKYLGYTFTITDQGPGYRFFEITGYNVNGIQRAYIAQVDPDNRDIEVKTAYAGSFGLKRATMADFVRLTGATGGINGGFFSYYQPLGLRVVDGRTISAPMLSRPCLALDAAGHVYIGPVTAICRAAIGREGVLEIQAVNDYPNGGLAVLTPGHPERIRGDFKGLKVVIEDDVVVNITDDDVKDFTNKNIIWDPYNNNALLKKVSVGDKIDLRYSIEGFPFMPRWVIQAGPQIVKDGAAVNSYPPGAFKSDITSGRSPRTAVAVNAYGELLLFMGEGRLSVHSIGFSLAEMADLLVKAGAVDAINLDGGGSSAMFYKGMYYGYPSAGERKPVTDALIFGKFYEGDNYPGF